MPRSSALTSSPSRKRVYVMVKAPRAGRVKTRLGAAIGMTTAACWYRHQTRALLRRIQSPRWEVVLAVAPDRDLLNQKVWPNAFVRVSQGPGDLGDRMKRLVHRDRTRSVAIIGSDIPGIGRREVADLFQRLKGNECAIGPSVDGGYWGIAFRAGMVLPSGVFQQIRWSTEHALEDTRASLGALSVVHSVTLRDVDTIEDLHAPITA